MAKLDRRDEEVVRVDLGLTVLGQAPTESSDTPFVGTASIRLAQLLGAPDVGALRRRARLENLLDTWPGRGEGGDAFPLYLAKPAAAQYVPKTTILILAGHHVAKAFNWNLPFCQWGILRGIACGAIPHPSGKNIVWNDPRTTHEVAAYLTAVTTSLGWWR